MRAGGHQAAHTLPAEQRGGEELEESQAKNKEQGEGRLLVAEVVTDQITTEK